MSVYSMTGYASVVHAGGFTLECRSVNSRFLDLTLKLPEDWRAHEPALRERVGKQLRRGKVELRLGIVEDGASGTGIPTPSAAEPFLPALQAVQQTVLSALPGAAALSVSEALQWIRQARGGSTPPRFTAAEVLAAADDCLRALQAARAREGASLVAVLLERIDTLEALATQAEPLVPATVARQQARFLERWTEALAAAAPGAAVDATAARERALGEAAAYALRIDVAEELARLRSHLGEIRRLLLQGGELGKRLDFLIQELHREANTLGSKASGLELTAVAVDMKVAIEQMREQVQNIE